MAAPLLEITPARIDINHTKMDILPPFFLPVVEINGGFAGF